MDKAFSWVMFSRWTTLVLGTVTAIAVLFTGLGLGDRLYWILLAAVMGAIVLWELFSYVRFARQGKSYWEFKRHLGDLTLAEVRRRKNEGRA